MDQLPSPSQKVTELLERWRKNDDAARQELFRWLEPELRKRAVNYLRRERHGHTLNPSDLVQETCVTLLRRDGVPWQNRNHLVACAATAMRLLLIDYARARGRDYVKVSLGKAEAGVTSAHQPVDLVALSLAIDELSGTDGPSARIIDLYYFGGLTTEEIAEVLGMTVASVHRRRKKAEEDLRRMMVEGTCQKKSGTVSEEERNRLEVILSAALKLAPEERESFVKEACNGDGSLQEEVASLLCYAERPGSLLDSVNVKELIRSMVNDENNSLVGRRVGRYHVIKRLDSGGMGEVYVARDTELDRLVVLKLLPTRLAGDSELAARFRREGRAAASLSHPNICMVYDVGNNSDGRPYIATEYVEGENLRQLLIRKERVLSSEAIGIVLQVADALGAAHARGVLHRDIKPENIMIKAESGLVKVIDFGLAKLSRPNPTGNATRFVTAQGAVMGTRYTCLRSSAAVRLWMHARTSIASA